MGVQRSRFAFRLWEDPYSFLIPALLAIFGFVALQSSVPLVDYQLNADSMYVFMIVKDIVFDGGTLRDWYTAVHLFIYPDMVLALPILLLQKLGLPVFIGCIITYGVLLTSLIALAWHKVTDEPFPQSFLAGSVLLGAMFCGDYLLYEFVLRQGQTPDELTALKHTYDVGQVLAPALHSGAFLLAFLLFFALQSAMNDAAQRSFSGVAVLVGWLLCHTFLGTLSDLMFVPWGIIPLSIIVLSGIARNSLKRSGLLFVILWVPGILGYLVSLRFSAELTYIATATRPVTEAVRGLLDFALLAVSTREPVITFFLGANVLLWCAGAYFMFRELTSSNPSVGRSLTILAASMSVGSILASVAGGVFTGWQIRYLIPYLFLGPMFCAFVVFLKINRTVSRSSWYASLSTACLLILAAGICAWKTLPGSTASQLAQFLKAHGLKSGRADFWDAAPVVVASGWRVTVAPLIPGKLELFPWSTKREWLEQARDTNSSSETFLILKPDLVEQARRLYGPADQESSCAGRQILAYKHAPQG